MSAGACQCAEGRTGQVGVVGYDDVGMAAWDSFSLTTIRQPSRDVAAAGVAMLFERVKEPTPPPRRFVLRRHRPGESVSK
jgi:DNA-binding LacI/PurR family transcriptional regulator